MEQFKCKMFSIELYNFLLVSVTDRIILKRNVHILLYVKSTEHRNMISNENIIRELSNILHFGPKISSRSSYNVWCLTFVIAGTTREGWPARAPWAAWGDGK